MSDLLSSSALPKSPRLPRATEYLLPPSPAAESGDELSPTFDQLLTVQTPEEYLQPALHSQPPYILSPTSLASSAASSLQTPTSDPLHLIIGDDSEEAAQGYTISCLADDFLQRGRTRVPSSFKEHQQQYLVIAPSEQVECNSTADLVQQKQPLDAIKRSSADLRMVMNSYPSSEKDVPAQSPGQVLGHRRCSSHGNPSPLLTGLAHHQSVAGRLAKESAFTASPYGEWC